MTTKNGLVCIVLIDSEKLVEDERRLISTFTDLNFEIFEGLPHKDINANNISSLVSRFINDPRDLPRIFIISTHGTARNELKDGDKTLFYLHQITGQFSRNSIPDYLRSVQKLIVVDACRGSITAEVAHHDSQPFKLKTYAIHENMYLMHSTVPGHLAWGLDSGSPFINSFCHCLSNFGHTKAITDNQFFNEMAKQLAENPIEGMVMNGETQEYDQRKTLMVTPTMEILGPFDQIWYITDPNRSVTAVESEPEPIPEQRHQTLVPNASPSSGIERVRKLFSCIRSNSSA